MIGRCKNCKHWGEGKPQRYVDYSPKKHCAAIMSNFSECLATISVDGDIEYGDYPVDLLTDPSFGCVLHEPREDATWSDVAEAANRERDE